MPIFLQGAVSSRVAGVNLGRVRFRGDERDDGLSARAAGLGGRVDEAQEDFRTRGAGANTSLSALLSRNQRAELILQRLQQLRAGTGSPADGSGRLYPGATNPIIDRAQNPMGRLNLPDGGAARAGHTGRPEFPAANRPETPPLDRERDADMRLLASWTGRQATAEAPTAEEISRANTTGEIRANLQAGARAVGEELQAAAARETAETTGGITRAAERAGEARQGEAVDENREALRELRTEARQLERELARTEREIRSRENQNARLQTGVSTDPTATAVTLGSRLNILSV